MDPLSLSAAIAGLLGGAQQVYSLLELIHRSANAPAVISQAQVEVKHFRLALQSLQGYLVRLDQITEQRKELISIDELIIALSDAMLAFSEFESLLSLLARLTRVRVAISWFIHSKQIDEHVAKVQRHKASLTLMCEILQCESDLQASESQERLQIMVEQLLADNEMLKEKMGQLDDFFDARSTRTVSKLTAGSISTSIIKGSARSGSVRSVRTRGLRFAFETILEKSWVYKRNERNECDISFISSAQRSHAWSIFSGISLAEISVKSVIAMPITTLDIANPRHYVMENYPGRIDLTIPNENPLGPPQLRDKRHEHHKGRGKGALGSAASAPSGEVAFNTVDVLVKPICAMLGGNAASVDFATARGEQNDRDPLKPLPARALLEVMIAMSGEEDQLAFPLISHGEQSDATSGAGSTSVAVYELPAMTNLVLVRDFTRELTPVAHGKTQGEAKKMALTGSEWDTACQAALDDKFSFAEECIFNKGVERTSARGSYFYLDTDLEDISGIITRHAVLIPMVPGHITSVGTAAISDEVEGTPVVLPPGSTGLIRPDGEWDERETWTAPESWVVLPKDIVWAAPFRSIPSSMDVEAAVHKQIMKNLDVLGKERVVDECDLIYIPQISERRYSWEVY